MGLLLLRRIIPIAAAKPCDVGPANQVRIHNKIQPKKKPAQGGFLTLAENKGFEPLRACTQHAFQACAIGH